MNKNVSIIVPAYNEEKYLNRCIDSIMANTSINYEIIIVDDGSRDRTSQICEEYKSAYPEIIRVIHKENGGLTAAWKDGCLQAMGDYIGFVDADDYIAEDMFGPLYHRAIADNSDIVFCGIKHVYEQNDRSAWTEESLFEENIIGRELLEKKYFPILINNGKFLGRTMLPGRYSKLTKRDIVLSNIDYCDNSVSIGEDLQFSLCTILDTNQISIIKGFCPYVYFMNGASMTMGYDPNYMDKIDLLKENLLRISSKKNAYRFDSQIYSDYLSLVILEIKGCICKLTNKRYFELRNIIKKICNREGVTAALDMHIMSKLTISERIFIQFIKSRWYLAMYICIRMYFK